MATSGAPVTDTTQVTVRLPTEMVARLDKLARSRTVDRSFLLRDAVDDFLTGTAPPAGGFARSVKSVWQEAVLRAFRDEGIWWTPMSQASFWDMHTAVAPKTRAVSVRVKRVGFVQVSGPQMFAGDIEWVGNVNTPEELYEVLREAIRLKVEQ